MLADIVSMLLANNLPKIAQVAIDKGTDYVSQKLGVDLKPNMTAEQIAALQASADKQEEFRIQSAAAIASVESENISKRWGFDMTSDSVLSKNIRPASLIFLLTVYTIFALLSAYGVEVKESYVELLAEWGKYVMLAYFGGRSVEKAFDLLSRRK